MLLSVYYPLVVVGLAWLMNIFIIFDLATKLVLRVFVHLLIIVSFFAFYLIYNQEYGCSEDSVFTGNPLYDTVIIEEI